MAPACRESGLLGRGSSHRHHRHHCQHQYYRHHFQVVVGGESKKIVGLLNSSRCSRVKCVELGNREHLDKKELADVFNALVAHSKNNFMETLLMSGTRDTLDLSAVHPFKLAGAVENLDALVIENCKLTEEQLNTLVLHLAELPTRLGRLSFPGADLKSDHDSSHHDHDRSHHRNLPRRQPEVCACGLARQSCGRSPSSCSTSSRSYSGPSRSHLQRAGQAGVREVPMGGLEEHGLVWVGPRLDGQGGQQVGGGRDVPVLSYKVESESIFC